MYPNVRKEIWENIYIYLHSLDRIMFGKQCHTPTTSGKDVDDDDDGRTSLIRDRKKVDFRPTSISVEANRKLVTAWCPFGFVVLSRTLNSELG